MRSFVSSCLLAASALVLALPVVAEARTIRIKGNLIRGSRPVVSTTGTCACVWSWNTVALRPGPVTVTTRVEQPATVVGGRYMLSVLVVAPDRTSVLKRGSVTCAATKSPCGKTLTLHLQVRQKGVYYIQVRGRNAERLWFSMTVRGRIQALRCNLKKRTCAYG